MIVRIAIAPPPFNFAVSSAGATQVTEVGQFKDWSAYTYKVDGKSACYAFSRPTSAEPALLDHGDIAFFVTTNAASPSHTEVSFQAGYELAGGSEVIASIGSETFRMFTDGKGA